MLWAPFPKIYLKLSPLSLQPLNIMFNLISRFLVPLEGMNHSDLSTLVVAFRKQSDFETFLISIATPVRGFRDTGCPRDDHQQLKIKPRRRTRESSSYRNVPTSSSSFSICRLPLGTVMIIKIIFVAQCVHQLTILSSVATEEPAERAERWKEHWVCD